MTKTSGGARQLRAITRPDGRKAGVLVVDDNPVNQLVATRMLSKLGCTIDVAGNGEEAIRSIDSVPYDLVFMDCQMPILDGYSATRKIRAEEEDGHHITIVAMTAHAMRGDREKCHEAGMDDYVSKPVTVQELARVLQHWVGSAEAA